jgi:hypothetical protein
MIEWAKRPVEEANLINPAYCSLLIATVAQGYESEEKELPFSVSFLILPMVLHPFTRNRLPRTTKTSIPVWLKNNPDILLGFSKRVKAMVPYTKEALLFGLKHNLIIHGRGHQILSNGEISLSYDSPRSEDVKECLKIAGFIGRWFAKGGSENLLYALFGIKP